MYVVTIPKIVFFASASQSFLFHSRRIIMMFVQLCVQKGTYHADAVCLETRCTLAVLKPWKDLQPDHGLK